MSTVGTRRPWRARLGLKLFASYLAVVIVGVGTLWMMVNLVAPPAFTSHMAQMMPAGSMPTGMMPPSAIPDGDGTVQAFHAAIGEALVIASTVALLTAGLVSAFVAGRVVGPVRLLARASRRLADGKYGERVSTDTGDELDELAASFNDLARALETTEQRRLELIGDVAHELRTPVSMLQVFLEGLLDEVIEPGPDTWARMHDETGRLRRLIDDLQELSRAEAHQIPLDLTSIDPNSVIQVVVDQLAPRFAAQDLKLAVDLPPNLPHVRADHDRAVQVLTNLLTNALRYTPAPGKIVVGARARAGVVEFSVADSGIGLTATDLVRVFDRFYRVDKSRSRAQGGAGVGLTIARALVEAMGGQIQAESAGRDQGTIFRFSLPIAISSVLSKA